MGNFSFLPTVKVEDAGKYMVKAENPGGEAQSIADFMVLESQPDRMVEVTKTTVFSDLPADQLKVGVIFNPHTLFLLHFLSLFSSSLPEPILFFSQIL
jgi:hypothetical protein